MTPDQAESCPKCGAPEDGDARHDDALHQIADYEARVRSAVPSPDEQAYEVQRAAGWSRVADAELVYDAVMAQVDSCVWSSTSGTDGCAKCSKSLSFKERVAAGHLDCARELAASVAAKELRDCLTRGGLFAHLTRVFADPRLGGAP